MGVYKWIKGVFTKSPEEPNTDALSTIAAHLDLEIDIDLLNKQEASVRDLVAHLINGYQRLNWEARKFERNKDDLENDLQRLEGVLNAERKSMRIERGEWKGDKLAFERKIEELEERMGQLRGLWTETKHKCERMENDYENRMTNLKSKHKEDEWRLRKEHDVTVQRLEGNIRGLENRADEREQEFVLEKKKLEKKHKDEQVDQRLAFEKHEAKLKQTHSQNEARLKQTHNQQQERLEKLIQSRNKALITRENFKGQTDAQIRSDFMNLVLKVNNLASLTWTTNDSPWTDELQSQISDTPKRLRKQILQDSIWNIFFEKIFCSPFRVFGSEGEALESQWNKEFGKDPSTDNEHYTWPATSFDAERWRYETIRQCQESLKFQTSELDPRTKIRKGFQASLETLSSRLRDVLEMVTEVDQKLEETVEELSKKAADMWILFGTQRCRLLVMVQDLQTEEEFKDDSTGHDKSVELLIQPSIKRIGDSDGENLNKEQIVGGCDGQIKKILYSR